MVKRKKYVIGLIIMFIIGCLLASGIYAYASSVKFKMSIQLSPTIYFTMHLNKFTDTNDNNILDNTESKTLNSDVCIFSNVDSVTANSSYARVNGLTITLILNDDLRLQNETEKYILTVTNYNTGKYMLFEMLTSDNNAFETTPTTLKNIAVPNGQNYYNKSMVIESKALQEVNYIFNVYAEIYDTAIVEHTVNNGSYNVAYVGEDYEVDLTPSNSNMCVVVDSVKLGETTLNVNTDYGFDGLTNILTIYKESLMAGVANNITITTTEKPKLVSVNLDLTGCFARVANINYYEGIASTINNISTQSNFNMILTQSESDNLRWVFDVTSSGNSVDYYWNEDAGIFSINSNDIKNDLTINVTAGIWYWDGSVATSFAGGNGSESSPFLIENADQLAYMRELINGVDTNMAYIPGSNSIMYRTAYYQLTHNIYLNEGYENYKTWKDNGESLGLNQWTPIGAHNIINEENSLYTNFYGDFNGDGFTVHGMYINRQWGGHAFIAFNYGTIKNLIMGNGYNISTTALSGVAAHNKGFVENCTNYVFIYSTISDADVNCAAGGVTGVNDGIASNCINYGEITGLRSIGGIVGYQHAPIHVSIDLGYSLIQDCKNYGTVTSTTYRGGGITGMNDSGRVVSSENFGEIIGAQATGGIVGEANNYYAHESQGIFDCVNEGKVTASDHYLGGVVGYNRDSGLVQDCINNGEVTSSGDNCGGVVGYNNSGIISSCANNGKIQNNGYNCGGVVGQNRGTSQMINCFNYGTINFIGTHIDVSDVGGCIGENSNGSSVKYCANLGDVVVPSAVKYLDCGGIVGRNYGNIEECFNLGVVNASQVIPAQTGCIYVGGIAGATTHEDSLINNCFNAGNVYGVYNGRCGGLAGLLGNSSGPYGVMKNCYNIGNVTPIVEGYTGVVIGHLAANAELYYCYSIKISANDTFVGYYSQSGTTTVVGVYYLDSSTKKPDNEVDGVTGVFETWDFENVWGYIDGLNDGYPILQCFYPEYFPKS